MEGIDVYHLLSGGFCQCISVAKVINFCVFIVTIYDINVTIEYCCARRARRFSGALLKLANVNLSYGRKFLTERAGGASTCCIPCFAWIWPLIPAAAAAARCQLAKLEKGGVVESGQWADLLRWVGWYRVDNGLTSCGCWVVPRLFR